MTRIGEIFEASTGSPHDAAFKAAFKKRELAKSFFRRSLPKKIVRRIDFRYFKLANGSYVDEKWKNRHSDIVYRTKIRGQTAFLYLLFEHQSKPDHWMIFRLLCYMTNLWREFIEQNPEAKRLPVVLPAVLYHGKRKWSAPRSLAEILEAPEGLERYIPDFAYELYDLRDYEDERLLLGDAMALGVVLYLMKHIFDDDYGERFVEAAKYLGKIDDQKVQLEFLEWMLRYTYQARDDREEYIDRGLDALENENGRRMAVTIAERLRQEGRLEGRLEGKLEGRKEGRDELILKLLKKRFGHLSPAIKRKLSESGVDVLDRFGESIFDFESLEDAERWWEDFENSGNA